MSTALGLAWEPLVPGAPALVVGGAVCLAALVQLGRSSGRGRWAWAVRAAMAVLATVAVLGPGLPGERPTYAGRGELQVVVVVDRTVSMSAVDGAGGASRLETARADLLALPGLVPEGTRLALVQWGSVAQVALPFTSDLTAWTDAVGLLRRESPTEGTGSRVDRPLRLVERTLEEARAQYPDRHPTVLLLSDGENTAPGVQRSFAPLDELVAGGAVLGYGTEAGGRMPVEEGRPGAGWVPDRTRGGDAVSRRDTANLRRLADEIGVAYVDRSAGGPAAGLADLLEPPVRVEQGATVVERPLTWLVALLLLPFVLVDLRLGWRGLHEARRLRWAR
ncbi:vWA domain-containing protein [Nocardioides sp. NPDC092400]|uniref:vWA domain-containing protein n=1 Tax=Nocardioides sp. NPDC092400 TaxID=3155196 RepID=UPI003435AD8A